MKADDVRAAMTTPLEKEPVVKMFGNSNTYEITTDFMIKSADADADKKVLTKLFEGVAALVNDASLTEEADTYLGDTLGIGTPMMKNPFFNASTSDHEGDPSESTPLI